MEASIKVWEKLQHKESIFGHKSRYRWIHEGDSNSKFFHLVMKKRFRRNYILALNLIVEDLRSSWKLIINSKRDFKKPKIRRPSLDGVVFNQLYEVDRNMLEYPFTQEKIKEVVWYCDGEKSHEPDRYNMGFFNKCWEFLKEYISDFVNEFYVKSKLPKAITVAFFYPKF